MAAGDPVQIDVTLAVLDRDGSTRGFVAGDISWTFGNGVDTPDLSATVSTAEADLAADPDLFDDALAVLLFDINGAGAAAVGSPFLVQADDLTLIGGDDQSLSQGVQVSAKSALFMLAEWQVTPAEGVWLRRSPSVIYFGWTHPDFDDSGWDDPTRRLRDVHPDCGPGTPKFTEPAHWENPDTDWLNDEATTGGLTLIRPPGPYTPTDDQQVRLATTADEEHRNHMHGPGYGGIVNETSKQETGYKDRNDFDRVLTGGEDYFPTFEMTTVNSTGGDGFDALSYYMGAVGTNDFIYEYDFHSGNAGIKVWRQDKDDPRPGLTPGAIMLMVQAWNQAWMTPTTASCHTVTFSFDAELDSNGDPWDELTEVTARTGTPVSQFMADLADRVDWDCHLDETDGHVVVDGYNRKGSDLSSAVPLVTGNQALDGNILSYRALRKPRTATRASVLTEDGYTTKVDTSAESTVTPRATYLEAQQSANIGEGKRLANRVLSEDQLRESFQATLTAVEGSILGVDCDWGDDVSAPDRTGTPSVRTLIKHGGNRSGDDEPVFTAEMV